MGCFSGCLMSSAGIQKLFCGIYSAFKCSFDEFVGEKVVSPSNSSTILAPPLYVFFAEMSVKVFCQFYLIELFCFLIQSCMSCLYILEFNLLSVASFENTFFHSEGCCFISFMDSFAMQKLLHLIRSHLFIFLFIFITLRGVSKKILLWFMSECSAYVFL